MLQDVVIGFLFGSAMTFGVTFLLFHYWHLFRQERQGQHLPFAAQTEAQERRVEDTMPPWVDSPGGLGR